MQISKTIFLTIITITFIAGIVIYSLYQNFVFVPFAILSILCLVAILGICITKPLLGFYIITSLAFLTALPGRLLKTNIPVSTLLEFLVFFLCISAYSKSKIKTKSQFYRSPITLILVIYFLFFCVELFNPNVFSFAGWIFYTRRILMFLFIFFTAYYLFDDYKKIKQYFRFWFSLVTIAALYACYQQWFGLLGFENEYLRSHPHEYKLYFQGGTIRKFSFLSDPTTFGILCGASATFFLILGINEKNRKNRRILFLQFIISLLGMSFSGTRTAYLTLPAGLVLYSLMTITNRTTLTTIFVSVLTAISIYFIPIHNSTLNRLRSTFNKNEGSVTVRDENRKYIQPYIYKHPLGGGIATSGVLGEKFNPSHPLAGFPPDSGLLLSAIETGWIGLFFTILVYLIILIQSVHFYFQTKETKHKIYIAAITATLFSIIITQYSQVSIGQLPTSLIFYAMPALLLRLKELEFKE